jgi:hypothetical protein
MCIEEYWNDLVGVGRRGKGGRRRRRNSFSDTVA